VKTKQFTEIKDYDRPAYEAWVAIWNDEENTKEHIAIAGPTLESLTASWLKITGLDLIADRAQHVVFIRVPK
jgi:hypothetical protein